MTIKKGAVVSVRIDKTIFPGKGLGYFEGRTVIVPNGIPGDVLEMVVTRAKAKVLEGRVLRMVTPSSLRRETHCSHYPLCGGCQLIDVAYSDQLDLKMAALRDALGHAHPHLVSKLADMMPCEDAFYYRNKMEFSFGMQDTTRILGLKQRGRFDCVVPIQHCYIQPENGNPILNYLIEGINRLTDLTTWNPHTHEGDLRHCVLRHAHTTDRTLLNLVVSRDVSEKLQPVVDELVAAFPSLLGVFMSVNSSHGDHTYFETSQALFGSGVLEEKVGDLTFKIPYDAFFQTNTRQMVHLYHYVKQAAQFLASDRVLDLYCGIGTIGLFCADQVASVVGIEENASAVRYANENQRLNGIENATFFDGRVKNILKFNDFDPTVIILDPPRAGIVPKALRRIIALNAPKIVYVSCNPSTCWRDLSELEAHGYVVDSIQPVDMFPHTFHVETVTVLKKR